MKINSSILILTSDLRMPAKLKGVPSLIECKTIQFVIEDFNGAMLEYSGLERVIVIEDFSDSVELNKIADTFLKTHNFDCVIAMDEFSQMPAAYFREVLGIPGLDSMASRVFRDKVLMKRKLSLQGVLTPQLFEFAQITSETCFPLIIKPRALAGAVGVMKVASYHEFKILRLSAQSFVYDEFHDMAEGELQAESFIAGALFHIDGICIDERPAFWCIGEYLNSQLKYLSGESFGSCSHDREMFSFVRAYLEQIFHALSFPDGAFHLEAFVDRDEQELIVLEIAARPGGGEISRSVQYEYGVDLNIAHVESQLRGGFMQVLKNPQPHIAHGWISVPFLTSGKRERLLAVNFDTCEDIEVLNIRSVPMGARLNHSFYSHERSLAAIIFKGERSTVLREIAKLCVDQCYEVFDSHE